MHSHTILLACFYAAVSALPSQMKDRQTSGLSNPGAFLDGGDTDTIPSSFPTSIFGGLGTSIGSSPITLPTSFSVAADAGGSSTENGLDGACQKVTLIFARGTSETGNMGTIVGPGLSTDSKSALSNNIAVQGVDYPADSAGISEESSGTGGTGTKAMVNDVQTALNKCPSTQIVLSGYSQGAMLVHNTMSSLSSAQAASVKLAVTFGDPFVGQAIKNLPSGAFKSYCASGDSVCSYGASSSSSSGGTTSASTSGHLGYGADTGTAATFIKGKVTI